MDRDIALADAFLFSTAVLCVYAGSRASVKMPRAARQALRKADGVDEASDDEDEEAVERITRDEAMWMPVLGSGMLLTLFFAVKYLDPSTLALLLNGYFGLVGVAGLTHLASLLLRLVVPRPRWRALNRWTTAVHYGDEEIVHLRFNNLHIVAFALSSAICAAYLYTRRWWLSNLMAATLAFNGICVVKLDSIMTGVILLAGLFVYDVWFVFLSPGDIMVSVAKGIDGPIKITWPREVLDYSKGFAMLGLGDIVVPGLVVAIALRLDYTLALKRADGPPPSPSSRYPRRYFHACIGGYVLGLATTFAVMHAFKSAQPALLYLSPACSLSLILTAMARGELAELWSYRDGEEDEKEAAAKKKRDESAESVDDATAPADDAQADGATADDRAVTTAADEDAPGPRRRSKRLQRE